MAVTIVFVRHAQGTHNISPLNLPSNFDAVLTPLGQRQTLENPIHERFDAVYCSPLRRCRETLLGIYPVSESLPVLLDDRLMEQPNGVNICDKRLEKADMTIPPRWNHTGVADRSPWVDDPAADRRKIQAFTEEIQARHAGQTILVVGHSNWIHRWFKLYKDESDVYLDNCKSVRTTI